MFSFFKAIASDGRRRTRLEIRLCVCIAAVLGCAAYVLAQTQTLYFSGDPLVLRDRDWFGSEGYVLDRLAYEDLYGVTITGSHSVEIEVRTPKQLEVLPTSFQSFGVSLLAGYGTHVGVPLHDYPSGGTIEFLGANNLAAGEHPANLRLAVDGNNVQSISVGWSWLRENSPIIDPAQKATFTGVRFKGQVPFSYTVAPTFTGAIYVISAETFTSSEDENVPTPLSFAEPSTATGTGVVTEPVVSLPDGSQTTASLTFDNVTTAGQTTITAAPVGPPPPTGFKLTNPPVFYDITTEATFTGSVRVCLSWAEGQIANENNVRMFHMEGGVWVDITDPASRDTTNNTVCGLASSLSPFTLFETETFAFAGFFSPVDNAPTVNSVKAGAGVPVKFALGGDRGLSVFATGYPRVVTTACQPGVPIDGIEETSPASSSGLQYDAATGRYTYVWKTDKSWAGSCRELQLKFTDGAPAQTATFAFTR